MQDQYSIAELCTALQVTRSGYHAWVARPPGPRAQADAALLPMITQAHRESRQTYGSPRIRIWLQEHGQSCGRQRIGKLMRIAGLNSRPRRRFRPLNLTDSNHDLPIAPNRLRELAAPQQRDTVINLDSLLGDLDELLAEAPAALQPRKAASIETNPFSALFSLGELFKSSDGETKTATMTEPLKPDSEIERVLRSVALLAARSSCLELYEQEKQRLTIGPELPRN
jgi:hypothetical protein